MTTLAPTFAESSRSEAARLIAELAPARLNKVFFTNGGAEATENAMRMARLHTGRHKVLTAYRSYHGATNGSITATGDPRRWASEPGMPGIVHVWGPVPLPLGVPLHVGRGGAGPGPAAPARDDHGRGAVDDRRDHARDRRRDQRRPRPPGRLPRGGTRAVRRVRHRLHRRRGDGRLRPLRRVVRRRPLGRRARPHHLRQGRQLRLRPARRGAHLRRDRRDLREAGVPGRADLLGPPARVRVGGRLDRDLQGRGDPRERPDGVGDRHRAPARRDRGEAPDRRRGSRARVLLGRRARPRQGDPRAARAVQRLGRGGRADGAVRVGVQGRGAVAVHPLQPDPRRARRARRPPRRWPRASTSSTRRSTSPTSSRPADGRPPRATFTFPPDTRHTIQAREMLSCPAGVSCSGRESRGVRGGR